MDDLLKEITGTMARDAQRRRGMLNQFQALSRKRREEPRALRPRNPARCTALPEAERHRHDVVREISHGVTRITRRENWEAALPAEGDPEALGDSAVAAAVEEVRRLNDAIRALMRERTAWDRRVQALGGRALQSAASPSRNLFFGVAKTVLPEAAPKRERPAGKEEREGTPPRESADGSDGSESDPDAAVGADAFAWRAEDVAAAAEYGAPLCFDEAAPTHLGPAAALAPLSIPGAQQSAGASFGAALDDVRRRAIAAQRLPVTEGSDDELDVGVVPAASSQRLLELKRAAAMARLAAVRGPVVT